MTSTTAKSKVLAETSSNGCGALLRYNQKEYILRQQNRLYKFDISKKQAIASIKLQSTYQDQIVCVCDDTYYEFTSNEKQLAVSLSKMQEIKQPINIPGIIAKNCVYCQFGNYLMIVDNEFLYVLDLINKELLKLTKLRKLYKNPKSVYISAPSEICIAYDRFYTVFDTLQHTWSETTTNEQEKAQMFLASNTSYLQFPDTKKTTYILMRQRNNGEPSTVYINKKSMFKNCRGFFQNNMMYTVDNCGTVRTLYGKQITLVCQNQDKFGHFRCDLQDEDEVNGSDEDFEEQIVQKGNKKQIKLVKKFQSIKPKKTKKIGEDEPKPSQRPKKLVINDFSAQQAEKVEVDNKKVVEDLKENFDLEADEKVDESLLRALEVTKKYTQQEVKVPTAKRIHPLLESQINDYESQLTNMKANSIVALTDRSGKEIYLHLNEFLPFENDKQLLESDIGFVQPHELIEPDEVINQQVKQLERFPVIFPANSDLDFGLEEEFKPIDNINIEVQHQPLLMQDGQQMQITDIVQGDEQIKQVELDVQQAQLQRKVIVMPEIKRVGGYVPTYENEFQPFDKRILNYQQECPGIDKEPVKLDSLQSQQEEVCKLVNRPQLQLADLTLSKEKVGHAKPKQYSKPMLRTRGGGLNTSNQKIGGGY